MALQGFLNIPDIDGESNHEGHEGEILVHGVHWKVEQGTNDGQGGRRRSRAAISAFTAQKFFDASSVYLAAAVVNGKQFGEITFIAHASDGDGQTVDYLTIRMTNCSLILVEDQHESHDPDDMMIHETLVISFDTFRITYVDLNGNGTEHEVEYGGAGKLG